MLTYIWIALMAIGILVAVGNDVRDEMQNTYRNGIPIEGTFAIDKSPGPLRRGWEGDLILTADAFNTFYNITTAKSAIHQPIVVSELAPGEKTVVVPLGASSPDHKFASDA